MPRRGRADVANAVRERIVSGVHVGRFRGGERLTPVRQLAEEFDVNERVVLGALRLLVDEGFIELRPRSGAYVTPPHPETHTSLPHLGEWLVGVLLQARARGLAPRALSDFVHRGMSAHRVRAACIECNADQLHWLASELTEDHGYTAERIPLEQLSTVDPPRALTQADLLVTTAFHADKVRRIATALGKPWVAVSLRADIMRDVGRYLRAGSLYYVATDPRFERKLRRMLGNVGPVANLRVMLIDRDDPNDIPANAPTFVMTSARDRFRAKNGSQSCPGMPIHPPRQFSDASARELLTFLVRANMRRL